MTNDLDARSTDDLLSMSYLHGNSGALAYDATWTLFRRWDGGVDIAALVALMRSERDRDRLFAAFAIGELPSGLASLGEAALAFADDPLSSCRRAFVNHFWRDALADPDVARGFAGCLVDLDLFVRAGTIEWAVARVDMPFDDLSRVLLAAVERQAEDDGMRVWWAAASDRRRAARALEIVHRLRLGEDVAGIRAAVAEEDSFVFDLLDAHRRPGGGRAAG